ncbi:MAG: ROK family protein, partial [Culicoidibacterales bacterium]
DLKNGMVLNPPNLPGWHNFALTAELSHATNRPVVLENDANLATFAEATVGAGKDHNVVQFITLSTGVGSGLVVDGVIFQGARGFAQEVANCLVDETCSVPGSTLEGSVERICSGTGIHKLAVQQGLQVNSTAHVFECAKQGDQAAQRVLEYVETKLANFIASIQGIIDPSVIVIGGSVALHNPDFIERIQAKVKVKVYPNLAEYVNIVIAECGDDAGVMGAGLLAHQQFIQGGTHHDNVKTRTIL